ncbi:hypothetical protein [Rhodococcoides corynebacterioides]|uniref:Uncharacterized protein n=1 Tax=Rhodococcoides corynebacterioides TaxID=53972 RepID=A0ABS7P3J7_9NOCA|nr:hypothetical protein [Rhodococcus corynebacterioides]MBY6366987.1 hypothetical protein [Rhodococcus corynebacterioides]MBY6407248.1 hypothetical protein [Rhodococcus corynebacterioides]
MQSRAIDFAAAVIRWSPQNGTAFTGADGALLTLLRKRNVGEGPLWVIHEDDATITGAVGLLKSLSAGGRSEVMRKGMSLGHREGCVVLAFPRIARLSEVSRGLQPGGTVVVFEYGAPPAIDGRMAATGAYDLRTGETTPLLDEELRETFTSMLMWKREIGEGARRGRQRHLVQRPLARIKQAGLDEDFVVTYCAALGLYDQYFDRLREHYRQA